MKIFDCFLFRDELDMLELRLNVLDPVVDTFVLVESPESFQRKPKPLFYGESGMRFAKWNHKIRHVVDDSLLPEEENIKATRLREKSGREAMRRGLLAASPDDVVVISDVDEIPDPATVYSLVGDNRTLVSNYTVRLCMRLYYYFFDCQVVYPHYWILPMAKLVKNIGTESIHDQRYDYSGNPSLYGAGWHFAYFGGVQQILSRFNSNSDLCHYGEEQKSPKLIEERRRELLDPNGKSQELMWTPDLNHLPSYVLENKDKYWEKGWFKVKP